MDKKAHITKQPTLEQLQPKQRTIEYIQMKVPKHLKDTVEILIWRDYFDFQSDSGRYRKW